MIRKRTTIIVLVILAVAILLFAILITSRSCSANEREHWTNVVDNYNQEDVLTVFLTKGETYNFDLRKQFEPYNIEISDAFASSSDSDVFTVANGAITATGAGRASLNADLYSKKEKLHRYVTAATVYVSDPNAQDIIEIKTVQDLIGMNDNKSGNYVLKSDLDLSSCGNWLPIGYLPKSTENGVQSQTFKGTFINPDGYKIRNLTINSVASVPQGAYGGYRGGLFGLLEDAYIDGIILENVNIDLSDAPDGDESKAGGIAGTYLNSVIRNCSVTGTIIATDNGGGIVGSSNWGMIVGCDFAGTVTSTKGIAGGISAHGHIVKDSNVIADIYGSFAAGGILGESVLGDYLDNVKFTGELICQGYKSDMIAYKHWVSN